MANIYAAGQSNSVGIWNNSSITSASTTLGSLHSGTFKVEDFGPALGDKAPKAAKDIVFACYAAFDELDVRDFFEKYFDLAPILPSCEDSDITVVALDVSLSSTSKRYHLSYSVPQYKGGRIYRIEGHVPMSVVGMPMSKADFAKHRLVKGTDSLPTEQHFLPKEVVFNSLCVSLDKKFRDHVRAEQEREYEIERMRAMQEYTNKVSQWNSSNTQQDARYWDNSLAKLLGMK